MWQIMWMGARRYAPKIMLPVTMVIGFIGYNIENAVRPSTTEPQHKSVSVSL